METSYTPSPVLSPRASCSCPAPLPYERPAPSSVTWDLPSSLGSLRGAVSVALICSSPFSRPKFLSHKRSDGLIHELTKVWLLPFPLRLANFLPWNLCLNAPSSGRQFLSPGLAEGPTGLFATVASHISSSVALYICTYLRFPPTLPKGLCSMDLWGIPRAEHCLALGTCCINTDTGTST